MRWRLIHAIRVPRLLRDNRPVRAKRVPKLLGDGRPVRAIRITFMGRRASTRPIRVPRLLRDGRPVCAEPVPRLPRHGRPVHAIRVPRRLRDGRPSGFQDFYGTGGQYAPDGLQGYCGTATGQYTPPGFQDVYGTAGQYAPEEFQGYYDGRPVHCHQGSTTAWRGRPAQVGGTVSGIWGNLQLPDSS